MSWLIIPNCERSTCSRESAEFHLPCSPGVGLCVTAKSTHTPPGHSSKIWQKVISVLPQYGITLQLSDAPKLTRLDRSSVLPAVSPVKILAVPAKGPESQEADQGCSSRLSESFAWLDRESSSWKTCQRSLFEDWTPFSESWPRAGIMLDGRCYRQPKLEHRICEIDFSCLLPTPTASDWKHCGTMEAAKRYIEKGHQVKITLLMQLKGFGRPHPEPIEEFMGYPIGWTAFDASETP